MGKGDMALQTRFALLLLFATLCVSGTTTWRVGMPKEDVPKADTYRCVIRKAPTAVGSITDVQAFPSDRHTVHHALLFMCADVSDEYQTYVESGESFLCSDGSDLGQVCTRHIEQLYGYDNMQVNDPQAVAPWTFPQDVGIVVGQQCMYKYALLQVHNNRPTRDEDTHFDMTVRENVVLPNKVVITQLVPAQFTIPAGVERYDVHVPTFTARHPIRIWGMHSHFHAIGSEVHAKVYRHENGTEPMFQYDFVKGISPSSTQTFKSLELRKGDRVEGLCRYNSTSRSYPTPSGDMHSKNEMCNIGMMLSVPTSKEEIMLARAAVEVIKA